MSLLIGPLHLARKLPATPLLSSALAPTSQRRHVKKAVPAVDFTGEVLRGNKKKKIVPHDYYTEALFKHGVIDVGAKTKKEWIKKNLKDIRYSVAEWNEPHRKDPNALRDKDFDRQSGDAFGPLLMVDPEDERRMVVVDFSKTQKTNDIEQALYGDLITTTVSRSPDVRVIGERETPRLYGKSGWIGCEATREPINHLHTGAYLQPQEDELAWGPRLKSVPDVEKLENVKEGEISAAGIGRSERKMTAVEILDRSRKTNKMREAVLRKSSKSSESDAFRRKFSYAWEIGLETAKNPVETEDPFFGGEGIREPVQVAPPSQFEPALPNYNAPAGSDSRYKEPSDIGPGKPKTVSVASTATQKRNVPLKEDVVKTVQGTPWKESETPFQVVELKSEGDLKALPQAPLLNVARPGYQNDTTKIATGGAMVLKVCPEALLGHPLPPEKYPSVTTILDVTMSAESRARLDAWKTRKIAELGEEGFKLYQQNIFIDGRGFHTAVETVLKGTPVETVTVPERNNGHWQSIRPVFKDISHVVSVEERINHPFLCYKGITDCVISLEGGAGGGERGELSLVEWKTSSTKKDTAQALYDNPLQVAAYLGAVNFDEKFAQRKLQMTNGAVVVAYENGDAASVIRFDYNMMRTFWGLWLKRLHHYWRLASIEKSLPRRKE